MLATMEAQSGLGQGSVGLRLGCRQGQGCAGHRHWRLSRAGRELWLLLRLRLGGALTALVVALVTAAAVAGSRNHGSGTRVSLGRGNMK